ncbi:MAG: aldo/keto reductase [Chloroflexi bacterium]|nr:aldo/keto reductase [Chloroflexota bacterium]
MKYRLLGKTGVKVSQLCFGTMSFGGDADEATSAAMFKRCRDAGINFFDCANVYQRGRAEEILGKLMAGCRNDLVITTKVHGAMSGDLNAKGNTRRNILREVEASLKRLGTDRIDVYFIHQVDPDTPLEETLGALDDLVAQGKVLYPALSNHPAWMIAKALGISALKGWARPEVLQPMYNLVKRQAEVEILPLAQAEQLGVITYSPLGGGLLTGKYGVGRRPEQGRIISNPMYASRYGAEYVYQVADDFAAFAKNRGYHPVSLAVAWVGSHPGVTAPIIGARNLDQLEPSLKSVEIAMTAELRAEVAALSPAPAPATDRSEEQAK